ncbi:interferon-induced very large GTPase 1-like [Garra rufa]|uniref:interferon-induced very large GTPase 1-like n=1 Tax=Garra rufa TaxID=137080 RepID=UPI003CCE78ED
MTPHRLHKISSKYSEYCPRCKTETGSLLHMFWTCGCLEQYWGSILDIITGILGVEIPANPRLTILGDLSVLPNNTKDKTRFVRLALIAANKCIAINWKSEEPPGVSLWLKELSSYLPPEKIMFNLRKKPSVFDKCWGGFLTFLHNRAAPDNEPPGEVGSNSQNDSDSSVSSLDIPIPNLTIILTGNISAIQFGQENILLQENVELSRFVPIQTKISKYQVSVINMTGLHEDELKHVDYISQLVNENEISAFIFVVRLDQLTDADKMGLEWLQRAFGENILQFVMILCTYERKEECDTIKGDLEKTPVQELLEKCGRRYHICSKMMNNRSEIKKLMKKIARLFNENKQQCYTGELYKTVLRQREGLKDSAFKNTVFAASEGRSWGLYWNSPTLEYMKLSVTWSHNFLLRPTEEDQAARLLNTQGKHGYTETAGVNPDQYPQENTEKIQHLLHRLYFEGGQKNILRAADVLQLTEHSLQSRESCAEEELIQTFLQKLLMMNYRARYINVSENNEHTQPNISHSYEEKSDADIFMEMSEHVDGSKIFHPVHPMDVQMAVFHYADGFLKQLMVNKLSQCQYALPLLVPDPFTKQIDFPLWTFRQINKSWKVKNTNNESISQMQPICKAQTPMVSFFRFGSVSSSKSLLMNSLINEKHNTFFHRNCPGSSTSRVLMDGVVEIAWYCPSGKNTDKFTECVAFCNLHGDAEEHEKQLQILTEMATVNVVLLSQLDRNDKSTTMIQNLYRNRKPLICLFTEDMSPLTNTRIGKYKIGLKGKNQSAVSEELRKAINTCISSSGPSFIFRLEDVSKCSDLRVDEEADDECRKGREAAQQMMSLLKNKKLTEIKESFLPCQGKLWHQWCQKNKELHRPQAVNIESKLSKKHTKMNKIRQEQYDSEVSEFINLFINHINSHNANKMYFLKWLGIFLDEYTSKDISVLHHKYDEKWSTFVKLRKNHDQYEQLTTELECISEKLQAVTFGLEHIMREIGQIYESCSAVKKNKKDLQLNFSSLPGLAAEIMITGFPLELMDGDAAHVPLIWISAVLDELIQKLGDKRVFVLSVLGIQSSGKSTMLNAMFGLQFAVSAGRCTRGAFMQLVQVSDELKAQMNFDYILVVDTEGLRALELAGRSTRHHDNELATFVIGFANLTLINIFGENPSEMQEILQIIVQAFIRMKNVKLNPSCMFVHQNISDVTAGEKNKEGRRRLQETLDEITKLTAEVEVCDIKCFSEVIKFDVQNDVKYFAQLWEGSPPMAPPNPYYCENVQELKECIISHVSNSDVIMLKDVKIRVKDLWEALLNEQFVFSFRNSVEISAYRKLETKYSKWSWSLRSAMLDIENKLYNEIENEAIYEVEENDLQKELLKTSEEVKKSMSEFFEKDTDAALLSQWKTSSEVKIKELQENIVMETMKNLNTIIQLRGLKKKIDIQRTHHENILCEKSKELALKLKEKTNDEETLKKEFASFWEQTEIKEIIKEIKQAKEMINDQHRMFRKGNDPVLYLEKRRDEYCSIFKKYCHGAASAAIFGEIICQKLKEPIEQSVYKKCAKDVTDELRTNCESLNGNRSNLEIHILRTLAEEEDFDKYINYINTPRDHCKSFIVDEVIQYITDKFDVSVLPNMCKQINLLQQKIMKAAHESTEHVQVTGGGVGLWLKYFMQQLLDVIIFSEKDLSGVKHDDVDDFKLLEDMIRKELAAVMSDISSSFNTKDFLVNLDYKDRPYEILNNHFSQCCWVQCPFCRATCTNTIENHDGDHSVPFHRSIGLSGIHYNNTSNLSTHICTSAVAHSNLYFYPVESDDKVSWREYKRAGGEYAKWTITPDLSELPYWKWFVCRFQKELEKYYNKTFEGQGEIPDEWRKYTKQKAFESLDKYI